MCTQVIVVALFVGFVAAKPACTVEGTVSGVEFGGKIRGNRTIVENSGVWNNSDIKLWEPAKVFSAPKSSLEDFAQCLNGKLEGDKITYDCKAEAFIKLYTKTYTYTMTNIFEKNGDQCVIKVAESQEEELTLPYDMICKGKKTSD